MPARRHFSLDEANALLGELRERLGRLQEARGRILRSAERIRSSAPANGGGRDGGEQWEAGATVRREIEALAEAGIVLRDAQTGLVDFPSIRDGREVFLCWRLDEDEVGHWHEVDAGFSGRRPL
jgi:hypothetical protein